MNDIKGLTLRTTRSGTLTSPPLNGFRQVRAAAILGLIENRLKIVPFLFSSKHSRACSCSSSTMMSYVRSASVKETPALLANLVLKSPLFSL